MDNEVDDELDEPADEVQLAWSEEIARRIADIDAGRVKTVPAEEAERIIWESK